MRENAQTLDQVNIDLTFYVFYNLANMYHASNLHQDALNTYTIILKNKQYPQASRLRVNMGNIYFEQKKYEQAIKMYNMALDSTTAQNKDMKMKIKGEWQWIEIGGCGMVDPNVLEAVGVDPEEFTGFAFGLGIERVAMRKYGISDIRWLYENDVRFLDQF